MDKCCKTCAWYSNGLCYNEKMIIKREVTAYAVERTFDNIRNEVLHYHPLRSVVEVFRKAVIDWLGDMNFEPSEIDEFYCKYYE